MAQFAGREKELEALERLYSADGLRTCSVYGRSRTGTSGLVREFCKGKPAIIVRFPEGTLREMLESICDSVTRYTSEDIPLPADYDEAFSAIGAACGGDGTVVVLDDTANADSLEFRKALGRFIDGHIRDSDNMLILCGSPENAMVSMTERSPLKDRIKDAVVLRPLSFAESRELHGKMKDLDAYKCHLTVGGIPLYHLLMNKSDYETCIEKCFLGTYPRLCAEAENIVRKSSVPYRYCSAILSEMAKGCGRPIDLANDQGISRQLCEVYLKKMESEGMIARVNPIANAPKKPVFTVKNLAGILPYGDKEQLRHSPGGPDGFLRHRSGGRHVPGTEVPQHMLRLSQGELRLQGGGGMVDRRRVHEQHQPRGRDRKGRVRIHPRMRL